MEVCRVSHVIDETPFRIAVGNFALGKFLNGIRPVIVENICDWCERNIDLSYDHTTSANGKVRLYSYQREPLEATDNPECQEVTLCFSQRLGKSSIWKYSLLKHVHDGGCSGLIVYPSMALSERTNQDTVLPLLQTLPDVAKDLSMRGNRKVDSYHMPSQGSVLYFLGGGAQVISSTANFTVLDESDFIELQNADDEDKNMSQIKALRIRMQSFKRRMMIVCSSPTQYGGVVYQNWKRGSMGEWNMRCLKCGELSPTKQLAFYVDGNRWAGLQWRKDDNGEVIEDSIRWVCPHCLHEHVFADAQRMNDLGQYVHLRPSNVLHRSFQCGALGNPMLWTWREIAQAQEDATDGEGKKFLANSILSQPYKHRADGDAGVSIEDANHGRQIEYPADLGSRLCLVTAGIDQQKSELAGAKYYVSVVRGWDDAGNSWLLSAGTDNTLDDVAVRLDASYHGRKVAFALIDSGGFSIEEDVRPFVDARTNCFLYKGTDLKSLDGKDFKLSGSHKLWLCNALGYQVKLLDLLYSPKRASGYAWNLPRVVDDEYFRQLCNVQPNTRMGKDGNGYEYVNWHAFGGARRDFFDSEKMALAAMEIACSILPAHAFPSGHKPTFWVREQVVRLARMRKIGGTPRHN